MKHILLIATTILSICSCTSNQFEKNKKAITTVLDNQAKCWNNGNIDGYMEGYWKSDSLRFLGKNGITKGWHETLNHYKKSYPNKRVMGTLTFNYISFESFNDKNMFVVGKWTLEREEDTLGGYYNLIFEKINSQWKIIFDHTN